MYHSDFKGTHYEAEFRYWCDPKNHTIFKNYKTASQNPSLKRLELLDGAAGYLQLSVFENQQPENNINVLEAVGFDMRSPYLEKVLYKTIQKRKFAVWYNKSGFINAED